MRKRNFNSLENLKAADEWIERAVAAEKSAEKKKPFHIRARIIGTAAAVVLTVAVSLIALNLFPHNSNVKTKSVNETTFSETAESVSSTASNTAASSSVTDKTVTSTAEQTVPALATETASETKNVETETVADKTQIPYETRAERQTTEYTNETTLPEKQEGYPVTFEWSGYAVFREGYGSASAASSDRDKFYLPLSKLYLGSIEVKIGKESAFFDDEELEMTLTTFYTPLQKEVSVSAYMFNDGNGRMTFCPFERGVYIPCDYTYSVLIKDDNGNEKTAELLLKSDYTAILKI